jgi:hypothetical protein
MITWLLLRLEWGHIHLSNYWAIPLAVFFWCKLLEKSENCNNHLYLVSISSAISLGFSGPYYIAFGAFGAFGAILV